MIVRALVSLALHSPWRLPPPRLQTAEAATDGAAWVDSLGGVIHGSDAGAAFYDAFASLAASREFALETYARKPLLMRGVAGVAGSFTLDDLRSAVDGDFLDAGRGIPDVDAPGGWKMAPVSQPRGASFEEAKMRYVDVESAMKKGTVVINSAGANIAP